MGSYFSRRKQYRIELFPRAKPTISRSKFEKLRNINKVENLRQQTRRDGVLGVTS